jgi:hypothetical protein
MGTVTQAEARALVEPLRRRVVFIGELRERMEKTGPQTDPLYPLAKAADDDGGRDPAGGVSGPPLRLTAVRIPD